MTTKKTVANVRFGTLPVALIEIPHRSTGLRSSPLATGAELQSSRFGPVSRHIQPDQGYSKSSSKITSTAGENSLV